MENVVNEQSRDVPSFEPLYKKIDAQAIWVWRVSGIFYLPAYLAPVYFTVFNWWNFDKPLLMLLLALLITIALTFCVAWLFPVFRWRHWFYAIDDHYVVIKNGVFFRQETIIPYSRVQLVDVHHGPILRSYGLTTLGITTAGGTHYIPALSNDEADIVKSFIASKAQLHEVDV